MENKKKVKKAKEAKKTKSLTTSNAPIKIKEKREIYKYLPDMANMDYKICNVFRVILNASSQSKEKDKRFKVDRIIKCLCNDDNPDAILKTDELKAIIKMMYLLGLLSKIYKVNDEENCEYQLNIS